MLDMVDTLLEKKISPKNFTLDWDTKANVLKRLKSCLDKAIILPLMIIERKDWRTNRDSLLEEFFKNSWADEPVIVRSSALTEDTLTYTHAGKYLSVPNIIGRENLSLAIDQVFESYIDTPSQRDQIFIQPFLRDVKISGVIFTKDPSSGADYFIINYDATTGKTDTITSGEQNHQLFVCYGGFTPPKTHWSYSVIDLSRTLMKIFNESALDIEFAVDQSDRLFLFQVRKLHLSIKNNEPSRDTLERIYQKIHENMRPYPYLAGEKTIYGVMPDWNPAEIIGLRPSILALSLYKILITDNIWAYQRDNYGYRNLRSYPLLIDFSGLPYIDTRVSFNSFIPKTLSDVIANKLVNYYLYRLESNLALHDKVEFEIVFSCYTFNLREKLKGLLDYHFTQEECDLIFDSLVGLTNDIIHNEKGLWCSDFEKIEILIERQESILNSQLSHVAKIYWLIEDCKRYGTLPFAGLARASFIGIQILKSMVSEKIITIADYDKFLLSIDSVSSRMTRDFHQLSKNEFLNIYGHLRPGTYDILSSRYDKDPDKYFDFSNKEENIPYDEENIFALTIEQLKKIQQCIKSDGIDIEVLELFDFIKKAAELREYSKFIFTKSVSAVLELIAEYAEKFGFSREDCSSLNISDILNLYSASYDEYEMFKKSIFEGKIKEQLAKSINLPPVILKPEDVWSFTLPAIMPNFITQRVVEAKVICVNQADKKLLENMIVFIPSADPGYDWLFSHKVAGFVTKYGGANSHMAIRANELGIPAVIGAGELFYEKWQKAKVLNINCFHKQVLVVQ